MIQTPAELAFLIHSLLAMQDHLIGAIALGGNAVIVDIDQKCYQITVTRCEVPKPLAFDPKRN